MTVILVLGLLAITLSLSYAMLRTQTTSARIQANQNTRIDARQAAITGMQIALRKMHESSWGGVATTVSGTLDVGVTYSVTFATGDATLVAGHADRAKYPYRVTLTSVGTATGVDGAAASTHTVQTVVELVPRALSSQPAVWPALQNYTVRQWSNTAVEINPPVRIEGRVQLQGPLSICPDYPPDCRPWHGRIDEVGVFNKALSPSEIANLVLWASVSPESLFPSTYSSLGPSHWWRLNESSGSSIAAASAGGVTGSHQNGTAAGATGYSGRAAQFDGFNDYISCGSFEVSGNKLSLVAFVRADSWNGSTDARIISKATGTAEEDTHWMLSTTATGGNMRLRFRVRAGGSTKTLTASSGNLAAGTWYLAIAVYNGSDMILYLNGNEVGRTSKAGNLSSSNTAPVFIGECPLGSPRSRYLKDLEAMRVAGLGDHRPFSGPVELPRSRSDANQLSMLDTELATTTTNVTATTTAPISHPGVVSTYRLYPGGKTYNVQSLLHETQSSDLMPNVETNPLGIYRRAGALRFDDGVSVQGTIITSGSQADICIEGNNVSLEPATLPALHGSTTPIQLPVAMAADDVRIRPHTGTTIRGYVMAGDEFSWDQGDSDVNCLIEGKLLCGKLKLYGRTDWQNVSDASWESWLKEFIDQSGTPSSTKHFTTWVDDKKGRCYDPLLTIRPATTAVTYHWQDWSQPIFVVHPSDAGLIWKIIRWVDDP